MRVTVIDRLNHGALIAALSLLCACAGDPVSRNERSGAAPKIAGGRCSKPGPVACYCDDGQPRGMQTCQDDGSLSACVCGDDAFGNADDPAPSSGGSASPAPSRPRSGPLCADLAGSSACATSSYESSELPSNILFVLDRSGSMACNPPPTQESAACEMMAIPTDGTMPSKWEITVGALGTVFDAMLTSGSAANVGLTFFSNDSTCGVQSTPTVPLAAVTAGQVAALKDALAATIPSGGTPLVGATSLAYAYLHQEATQHDGCQEPCGANGNRYVVLITDGADSCPNPARAEDAMRCSAAGSCPKYLVKEEAPQAAAANIKTFVIGAPGSEPARGYLSELAFVGGTARNAACSHDAESTAGDCHYDMSSSQSFATELASALDAISTGAALGCDFGVPEIRDGVPEERVNVQLTGSDGVPVCFKYDESPCEGGANGWQFRKLPNGSKDLTRVAICGDACDRIRADASARVDVILGCKTLTVM